MGAVNHPVMSSLLVSSIKSKWFSAVIRSMDVTVPFARVLVRVRPGWPGWAPVAETADLAPVRQLIVVLVALVTEH